ncbi:MAG TPA: hypothetical protein VK753_08345 [Xanthomonadaceae bacterium]|jgi:hypothetical protein|nr:hypothetical protein [Xanthomonadaceae bacterium]
MIHSTAMQSVALEELSLEDLLANVMRCTGWIVSGGSAQFRHGALAELQSNLHLVHRQVRNDCVLQLANTLDDKATRIAANKVNDAQSVLGLCRVLGEFEQAMKACMGGAKWR